MRTLGKCLYVIGGCALSSEREPIKSIERVSIQTNDDSQNVTVESEICGDLAFPRRSPSVFRAENGYLIAGGCAGPNQHLNSVEFIEISQTSLKSIPSSLQCPQAHSCAAFDPYSDLTLTNAFQVFKSSNRRRNVNGYLPKLKNATVIENDGDFVIFGGWMDEKVTTDTVRRVRFDAQFSSYEVIFEGNLPYPVEGHCLVQNGTCVYLIGGFDGISVISSIIRYDLKTKKCQVLGAELSEKRENHVGGIIGGKYLVVAGGWNSKQSLDSIEVFELFEDAPFLKNSQRIPSHFLVELTSLDELAFPANSTKRVKYTCVASTSRSLILGTSTGTVYIFSRYAAKSKSRAHAPVPVHVFTTRDGQISTICMNATADMMAIGGDSGRVSVAQINDGTPPTLLYTTPGDARAPDRVTALAWGADQKQIYSGHSSGAVHLHRLGNRSIFRASHQRLAKFENDIVQLDVYRDHIIVSTTIAAFLFHIENGTTQQIGTKTRSSPSPLGACHIAPPDGSAYIVAARPNGRIWESNLVGVVYRTHQFRQNSFVPRAPPISFRGPFPTDSTELDGIHPENQDVSFYSLRLISVDEKIFVVSAFGSRICIVDTDSSRIVLVAELEHEMLDVSTCGSDVFVLFTDSKGLRKFSLFERRKSLEKLHLKSFFTQSAPLVLFCWPHVEFPLELVEKSLEGLAAMSKKKETEKLQLALTQILEEMHAKKKACESVYENSGKGIERELSKKLPSGVHRVLRNVHESGYDDDFSFNTPQALRECSRSSPCFEQEPVDESRAPITKRSSVPSSLELKREWRKNGTPDVVEEDILHRARVMLDSDGQVIEKESLRTLLQLEGIPRDEIRFTPTVTIGNAAKALAELALAVPVDVSSMWNRIDDEDDETEEKQMDKPVKSSPKPTIVKVVRPGDRPRPVSRPKATPVEVVQNNVEKTRDEIPDEVQKERDELWLDLRLQHIRQKNIEAENSGEIPNSDTETTLTSEQSILTPTGNVWTNPLDESVTPTKMEDFNFQSEKSCCRQCGMHRSWAAVSLLITVCARSEVISNEFSVGGVPSTTEDWMKLLRFVASRPEHDIDLSAMCPRCETALSGVNKVIGGFRSWSKNVDEVTSAESWRHIGCSEETKVNVEKIRERVMNISDEKLRIILSRTERQHAENGQESNRNGKPHESTSIVKPVQHSGHQNEVNADFWKWTNGVKLKTFLAIAVFCDGKKNVLNMITQNDRLIARQMSPEDWSAMVVMCSREVSFKNLINFKTINNILKSAGVDEYVAPKKVVTVAMPSRRSVAPMNSWIVDSNGKCPICSLLIKMIVGGVDRGIVSYSCGHVYHKMCLAGRFSSGCVACRVRARRAAVRGKSTPTGSPNLSRKFQ
ncbi:unnamed protein product [Caenorhabditis bovis]|uniref:RING-type domain-containing protein n=1 Tax=Caenorhabditis bovis TaxID=2654633 RepID=A0A8S1F4H9_9PELO|nr:unnamed protein product [Caenorhabditis bovis]